MCVCVCVFVCVMSVRLCNCHLLQLLANVLSVSLCMRLCKDYVCMCHVQFLERDCVGMFVCVRGPVTTSGNVLGRSLWGLRSFLSV